MVMLCATAPRDNNGANHSAVVPAAATAAGCGAVRALARFSVRASCVFAEAALVFDTHLAANADNSHASRCARSTLFGTGANAGIAAAPAELSVAWGLVATLG